MKKIFLLLILFSIPICAQFENTKYEWLFGDSGNPAGLFWNKTTDTYVRLGSAKGKTRTFFDGIAPFKNIRRCNLSDAGIVNAYYGDAGYIEDGSNGQVMVEIPKFYYRVDILTNGYNWWASQYPFDGCRIHPAFIVNGVIKNKIYIGAFEGSVYDVTANAIEINTITITHVPTSNGNLTITLDGNYVFTVAVLTTDNMNGVTDKIVNAGNKTDYQGTVWTVAKVDSTHLTYTSSTAGLKTTLTMPTAAGVTSTIIKTVAGAGGYVLNDAAGVSFTATTGDKLSSVANVKPISGWENNLTIANTRILAHNRGVGWEQQDYLTTCAIQLLYLIEYDGFNSQVLLSAGITNITDDALTNMSITTGYTGTKVGGTNLGNVSGEVTVIHYKTAQSTKAMCYRGIENFYGNIWKFVDGINIKANNNLWIADNGFVSNTYTLPYINTGLVLCSTNGYPTDIKVSNFYNYQFLASTIGGSTSTYLTDYYYQNTGNKIAMFGGDWFAGGYAGGFGWYLGSDSGIVGRSVGGRLLYK
jgi:hypothetical protein